MEKQTEIASTVAASETRRLFTEHPFEIYLTFLVFHNWKSFCSFVLLFFWKAKRLCPVHHIWFRSHIWILWLTFNMFGNAHLFCSVEIFSLFRMCVCVLFSLSLLVHNWNCLRCRRKQAFVFVTYQHIFSKRMDFVPFGMPFNELVWPWMLHTTSWLQLIFQLLFEWNILCKPRQNINYTDDDPRDDHMRKIRFLSEFNSCFSFNLQALPENCKYFYHCFSTCFVIFSIWSF